VAAGEGARVSVQSGDGDLDISGRGERFVDVALVVWGQEPRMTMGQGSYRTIATRLRVWLRKFWAML
jgi:hypothetical protein